MSLDLLWSVFEPKKHQYWSILFLSGFSR